MIESLKHKYPDVKFVEVESLEDFQDNIILAKNIDDLISIKDVILFTKKLVDSDTSIKMCIDLVAYQVQEEYALGSGFVEYVFNKLEEDPKFKKRIIINDYNEFIFKSLNSNLGYTYPKSLDDLPDYKKMETIVYGEIIKHVDGYQKYLDDMVAERAAQYAEGRRKEMEEVNKRCAPYVKRFKDAKNNSEKDDIIKEIQIMLKTELGLDPRGSDYASKVYLKGFLRDSSDSE